MAKCPSESSWTNLSGDQQLERHQRDARTKREEIRSALRSGAVIWRRSGRGHHGRPPEPSRSPRHAGQARRSAAIEPSHHVRDNYEKPSLTKTRLTLHTGPSLHLTRLSRGAKAKNDDPRRFSMSVPPETMVPRDCPKRTALGHLRSRTDLT